MKQRNGVRACFLMYSLLNPCPVLKNAHAVFNRKYHLVGGGAEGNASPWHKK